VWPAWLFVLSLAVLSLLFHSLMRMMLSSSVQLSLAVLSSSYAFSLWTIRSVMTVCMSAPVDLHLVYSNHFPGQCAKHAYVLDFPHIQCWLFICCASE
jgi:hypothetical protein